MTFLKFIVKADGSGVVPMFKMKDGSEYGPALDIPASGNPEMVAIGLHAIANNIMEKHIADGLKASKIQQAAES